MYFAYGWPKALAVQSGNAHEDVVQISFSDDYLVIVSTVCVQIWSGGQLRVRLGQLRRELESVKGDGLNRQAVWCSSRRLLAVLTYNNVLHVYGLHTSKEAVLPALEQTLGQLRRVDVYLQHSTVLDQSGAHAVDLVCDSRSILIGFSDGTFQLMSWQSQLKGRISPFAMNTEVPMRLPKRGSSGELRAGNETGSGVRRPSASRQGSLKTPAMRGALSGPLGPALSGSALGAASRAASVDSALDSPCIEAMDYASALRTLAVVLTDGACALLRAAESGLAPAEQLQLLHWVCSPGSGALCVRIGTLAQLLAVGLNSGEVALYKLWAPKGGDPLRIISLADWGYEPEVTGSVADLQWSPDNRALAVGWRRSGLGLWTPSGCRLLCSVRQARTAPMHGSFKLPPPLSFENGVAAMAWGACGYRLVLAEAGMAAQVLELSLAKSLTGSHRIVHHPLPGPSQQPGPQREVHLLQADDRLLLITEGAEAAGSACLQAGLRQGGAGGGDASAAPAAADLGVVHLQLPAPYLAANWPLAHAALSADGMDIAVAGRHGLALYSRRSARWRLFGDVSQEREITVHHLTWLPRVVLACVSSPAAASAASSADLLLYPRYHLDNASLLGRFPLQQVPLAMDASGSHVVAAYAPLDIKVWRIDLAGSVLPSGKPSAKITIVRELSIMSVGQPLRDIALVERTAATFNSPYKQGRLLGEDREPHQCVLLRAGGHMSVLDMEQGSELTLANDVECFWLSGRAVTPSPAVPVGVGRMESQDSDVLSLHTTASRGGLSSAGAQNGAEGIRAPLLASDRGMHSRERSQSNMSEAFDDSASTAGSAQGAHVLNPFAVNGNGFAATEIPGRDVEDGEDVEIPWWTYGARGMQLWFPKSLAEPVSHAAAAEAAHYMTDPELEFDREVYPISVSLAEVSIIGVTQRVVRSAALATSTPSAAQQSGSAGRPSAGALASYAHAMLPLFQPLPESQPVLPCLLRRLLQQERVAEALSLASRHSRAPHFARSLEWLLFTSLEFNADLVPSPSKAPLLQSRSPGWSPQQPSPERRRRGGSAGPLLLAAASLIRRFPQFRDIVVSVARKTDAAMWPALFQAVGAPSELLDDLIDAGALASAACCLLIVDRIEGSAIAHSSALRLIRLALAEAQYDLAAELLRFVVPPTDSEDAFSGLPAASGTSGTAIAGTSESGRGVAPQRNAGWLRSWFSSGASQPDASTSYAPGAAEGEGPQVSAGTVAWRALGTEAWRLLDSGRLRNAACLGAALSAVGGSMPALLLSCRPPDRAPPTPLSIARALEMVEEELPVVPDLSLARNAQVLLDACHGAGLLDWSIALALALENSLLLSEYQAAHPDLWRDFSKVALASETLRPYWSILGEQLSTGAEVHEGAENGVKIGPS